MDHIGKWMAHAALALGGLLAIGCGTGTGPGSGTDDGVSKGGPFTAKVDGVAWAAESTHINAEAEPSSPGCLFIAGSQVKDGKILYLGFSLYNLKDTGTYALGTGISAYGGIGKVMEGRADEIGPVDSWSTPGTGLDGEFHVARLTANHITADFRCTTMPDDEHNTRTGNRMVTEGHLDLDFTGTLAPVADANGGRLTAKLNGKPYNAADIYASLLDSNGNSGVTLNTNNTENAITLSLAGVTSPGTYAVIWHQPNPRSIIVGRNGGTAETCCWGAEGDTAEVIITSLTPTRVKGTFRGSFVPQAGKPATAKMEVTEGAFDVGIP
jgi:hypothetical protein